MEPPLVEGIIGEGRHRSIVVWEGLKRDVESPHRRCPYCYSRDTEGERPDRFDVSLTDMGVHKCDQRKPQRNRGEHCVGTTAFGRHEV